MSGYLLRFGAETVLVDSGSGTFDRMARAGVSFSEINHYFYTHTHVDHTADLIPLLFSRKNCPGLPAPRDLTIYGPEGFLRFFDKLMDVYGDWVSTPKYKIHVEELDDSTLSMGRWKVRTLPLIHGTTCVGYRFEDSAGKSVVFSGDTGECENIVTLGTGADVMVLECSFDAETEFPTHLNVDQVVSIANRAGCKKLVLTHLYPQNDPDKALKTVRASFSGEVILGEDLMTVSLKD
jgi:ribonuclease BN (tRNA processing enzyme)